MREMEEERARKLRGAQFKRRGYSFQDTVYVGSYAVSDWGGEGLREITTKTGDL